MKTLKLSYSALAASVFYMIGAVIVLLQYRKDFSDVEVMAFYILVTAYIYVAGIMLYAKIYHNLSIFEPFFFVSVLYLGIFVIKPIADLNAHNMVAHGTNVIDGTAKATLIFLISYTCFYIGYYGKIIRFQVKAKYSGMAYRQIKTKSILDSRAFLYFVWSILFLLCLYCMHTQGISMRYIFSFGREGEVEADESSTALLFLSNFGITLLTVWLLIVFKSRNLPLKIFITVLTIVYLLMRNGRWLILVMILAPVTYHYLKVGKKPNMVTVLSGALLMLIIFAWMQINKVAIRMGDAVHGWGDNGLTLELLLDPLESDLSTYKTFYAMVTQYPEVHPYMMGKTFFYTFILFIPRALWHAKPDNPVRDMTENSLGAGARKAGTAVANIGEMYANFGIVGCIVLMFILGQVLAKLKKLSYQHDDRLLMYSLLYPLLFQWIARGNFSGNFYMTIFALLPFIGSRILRLWQSRR